MMRNLKFYIHTLQHKFGKKLILLWGIFFLATLSSSGFDARQHVLTAPVTSTQQQAIAYIEKISELTPSEHWPNIKPALFLKNLKNNIYNPVSIYPGSGTNFCGYGALTYLFLQDDPLGYATLLLKLYGDGKAAFRNVLFDPSPAIKLEAGELKYKGVLDINPAEQMWFLTLADHYKGYLNFFNHKFDQGDENTFWASVNYGKFNRMTKELLHYNSEARGADLMRPKVRHLYEYISERMKTGTVVLFINNRIVHKKDHIKIKLGVPTHFIVAEKISIQDDTITFIYWDYGHRTQLQVSTAFFKRIVFGISWFTKKDTDVQ